MNGGMDHREVNGYGGAWTTRRETGLGGDCVPVQHRIGSGGNCSSEQHRKRYMSEFMFHNFGFFLFCSATSAWFVVSPVQGVFHRPITPRVSKYFLERKSNLPQDGRWVFNTHDRGLENC